MEATSTGYGDGSPDFGSRGAKILREFFNPADDNASYVVKDFEEILIDLVKALDVLSKIVANATKVCHELGEDPQVARWDRRSLYQIVGKFDKTFEECEEIALMSIKHNAAPNLSHIVDWNPQVASRVQQLRERLLFHRRKLGVFFKPFEIDLLCRIRDRGITQAPLKGLLVSDLEAELEHQRNKPKVIRPEIPADALAAFDRQAYADEFTFTPLEACDDFFKYRELSPLRNVGGPPHALIPSVKEYISLLKCIWLVYKLQKHFDTYAVYPESHWLSFVKALEDELDLSCARIGDRLKAPMINVATMPQSLFHIRPERESTQLIGAVSRQPTMRQVYTGALESNHQSITRKVQLLRSQSGQMFRIRLSGSEKVANGKHREQTETIDIDLENDSTGLMPMYALPRSHGEKAELIVRVDEKIARLSFPQMRDILKFQHALTGFKPWAMYSQHDVLVRFDVAGQRERLLETACLQLWVPKYQNGEPVTYAGEPITDLNGPDQLAQTADNRRKAVETAKSRIVLFTQDSRSGRPSCVSIAIHPDTIVNPALCDCGRAGGDSANCRLVSLERRKRRLLRTFENNLDAKRYEGPQESEHIADWSMTKLVRDDPSAKWPNLRRVSIMFPSAESRARFSGTPSVCRCKIKTDNGLIECVEKGHRGLLGEVQAFERKRARAQQQNLSPQNEDLDSSPQFEDTRQQVIEFLRRNRPKEAVSNEPHVSSVSHTEITEPDVMPMFDALVDTHATNQEFLGERLMNRSRTTSRSSLSASGDTTQHPSGKHSSDLPQADIMPQSAINISYYGHDREAESAKNEDQSLTEATDQMPSFSSNGLVAVAPNKQIEDAIELLESAMATHENLLERCSPGFHLTPIDNALATNCFKQVTRAFQLAYEGYQAYFPNEDGKESHFSDTDLDIRVQVVSLIKNAFDVLKRLIRAGENAHLSGLDAMQKTGLHVHNLREAIRFLRLALAPKRTPAGVDQQMSGQVVWFSENDSIQDIEKNMATAQAFMISGNLENAVKILKEVARKAEKAASSNDGLRIRVHRQLAVALMAVGEVSNAVSQLVYIDKVIGPLLPLGHPLLRESRIQLAKLHISAGEHMDALLLLQNIAEAESSLYGEDDPGRLAVINLLAITYQASGQQDQAGKLLGVESSDTHATENPLVLDDADISLAGVSSHMDSGYGSYENSSVPEKNVRAISGNEEADVDDNETLYSVDSVTPSSQKAYIDEFSHRLADDIRQLTTLSNPLEPSYPETLPLLLKSFARRLHAESISRTQREVSVFLHKNRGTIVEALGLIPINDPFEEDDDDDDDDESQYDLDMNLPFRKPESEVNEWVSALEAEASTGMDALQLQDPAVASSVTTDGPPIADEYQSFVKQSEAYKWLLATIKGSWRLITPGPSADMSDMGQSITSHFLSQASARKVSRRTPPTATDMTVSLDWDLRRFIEEQQYDVPPAEVLDRAICITGTWREAQATTAAEYVKQVWPLTYEPLYGLLKSFLTQGGSNPCENVTAEGSFLHCEQTQSCFVLTMRGKLDFVLETVEQLGWFASALRPSPVSEGVVTCSPSLTAIVAIPEKETHNSGGSTSASCQMQFQFAKSESSDDLGSLDAGFCWSDLFRNPTIVSGYPILHRTKPNTGLDISIACMAKLIDSEQIFQLAGRIIIKGFCSMLVATEVAKDVVMWHLLFNPAGERISFCDERIQGLDDSAIKDVSLGALGSRQHIVGWCGSIQEYTGHPHANRAILPSSLPGPAKSFVIEKIYAEGGSNFIGGLTMSVGIRDKPVYLPRAKSYSGLLDWVSGQPVIFYDIDDRRAWLIDGASALLHLVRASIDQDREKPAYRSKWKFDGSLDGDTIYQGGTVAAIETLSNIENLNRALYLDDIRPVGGGKLEEVHYYFRDRVHETLHYLQVLIDHQAQVAAQDGYWFRQSGKILTKSLIGFDFWDIAKPPGPIRPRAYHLRTGGHGWIEYIRSVRATTIFGKKFGELLQAQDQQSLCPGWRSVPMGMDYLGASVATLKAIHEARNEAVMGTGEITTEIVWSSRVELFTQCGCLSHTLPTSKHLHLDPVQLLLPKGQKIHLEVPKIHGNITLGKLSDKGAVLFGHTPYRFGIRPPRDGGQVSSLVATSEEDDTEKAMGSAAMSTASTASNSTARATTTTQSTTSQWTDMTSIPSRHSSPQVDSGTLDSTGVDEQSESREGKGKENEEPKKSLLRKLGFRKGKK